jgi:hypothetical protein
MKINFKKRKKLQQKKNLNRFQENNKVFLNVKNIILIKLFKKFNYKYFDFCTINKLINKILYTFNFLLIMKNIHNLFHVFFLKFANNKNEENSLFI